jgi:DNA-binding transcriptional LysR family regulator
VWQTVEMRELRLFLTLADELHFGRTAEALSLTPSRVSQTLRDLEDKVGAPLVHRTSRRVSLTPFGEEFLREVRPAFEGLTGVLERTTASTQSLEGAVRLGLFSGPSGGPRLVEVIRAFEARQPECRVDVIQVSWDDPLAGLRANEVDAMAIWVPLEQRDVVVGPTLTNQARVLAVSADHPLAGSDSIDVEELADHRILRFDNWPKEMHDAVLPSRTPAGKPIPTARVRVGEHAVFDIAVRIARGEFTFPTVESAAPYMREPGLAFVPIKGMAPLRSALVWRRPARDPKLRAFIGVAREVLKRRPRSAGAASGP